MRRYWYYYDGTGSEEKPSNYLRLSISPNNCTDGQAICAVYAHPSARSENEPLASELRGRLREYLILARLGGDYYPTAPERPYVYLKT